MQKIVLASSNPGKMAEIRELLLDFPIELIAQSQLNIPDVEEIGETFFENAIIKARHAAKLSGMPALADDSGLTIHCLNEKPGVFSSRYAGPHANDLDRINKVLAEIKQTNSTDRSARFHCVIVLMSHAKDPAPLVCHGVWEGEILQTPRGNKGFGYDPIFYVPTYHCSVGELDPQVKNRISHRAKALNLLKQQIKLRNAKVKID